MFLSCLISPKQICTKFVLSKRMYKSTVTTFTDSILSLHLQLIPNHHFTVGLLYSSTKSNGRVSTSWKWELFKAHSHRQPVKAFGGKNVTDQCSCGFMHGQHRAELLFLGLGSLGLAHSQHLALTSPPDLPELRQKISSLGVPALPLEHAPGGHLKGLQSVI